MDAGGRAASGTGGRDESRMDSFRASLRASVLLDLVDRFSAGARKMAGLSSKLGKGLAGAQAELKQLQVK